MIEMDKVSYRRGWEDCLDVLYYKFHKAGIQDKKVYQILREIQAVVKEDKINRLMDELGLI